MSNDQPHVPTQPVEYLAVSEGLLGHPTTGEPIIILSLRPNPPSFFVVNIAVTKEQAWRLFADLQNVLVPFVLLVITTAAGCGARVEVESESWESSSGERARTHVEVDLLRTQRSELVAEHEEKKPAVAAEEKSVVGSSNTTIIVNCRGGDVTHHNETNVHINQVAPQRIEERVTVRREDYVEPRRQVDGRCEFLKKQHQERVEKWKKFPLGQ